MNDDDDDDEFYKMRYEKELASHDSYDYDYDNQTVNCVRVYDYEPDLLKLDLANISFYKREVLALIEALKEAVEVMEDYD